MKQQINLKNSVLFAFILSAIAWRIFFSFTNSPIANFTPIGAIALFGGYYFKDSWKSFALPLLTIWLSDLILNYFIYYKQWTWFYEGFIYTYGSFALIIIIGRFIPKVSFFTIIFAGISAALLHWIISDFGVWLDGRMYPKTWEGFATCYIMAIPYLKNMIISNIIFSGFMFGLFELMQQKLKFGAIGLDSRK